MKKVLIKEHHYHPLISDYLNIDYQLFLISPLCLNHQILLKKNLLFLFDFLTFKFILEKIKRMHEFKGKHIFEILVLFEEIKSHYSKLQNLFEKRSIFFFEFI